MFESLNVPEHRRVLITTEPDPIRVFPGTLLKYGGTDINISKWWDIGLEFISGHYPAEDDIWDVLLIETDARMTVEDVETVREHMRTLDCVQAGADWLGVLNGSNQAYHVRRDNSAWVPEGRMPGIAVIVAGEAGIRHDPEFRWWLADDDFEWQHRVGGGTVLVKGTTVRHEGTQGQLTGERLQAWEEDQIKFRAKWGGFPSTGGVVDIEVREVVHEPAREAERA